MARCLFVVVIIVGERLPAIGAIRSRARTIADVLIIGGGPGGYVAAIKSAQLVAVYQPIICTRTHRLHGAELLCRWPHPELGMISPDEFIPLAEEMHGSRGR